ncbi:hypothetical protein NDU88_002045 [Pleurodeles waltl]|uniref:Uncharacterized protein n=1 Tax=Pleurodeles waltl TaxID=8319 RepID=A0AAV7LB86_PLEWA|nr:hypothetical protein NDU88_002045 [Pleurodeles waltl]
MLITYRGQTKEYFDPHDLESFLNDLEEDDSGMEHKSTSSVGEELARTQDGRAVKELCRPPRILNKILHSKQIDKPETALPLLVIAPQRCASQRSFRIGAGLTVASGSRKVGVPGGEAWLGSLSAGRPWWIRGV